MSILDEQDQAMQCMLYQEARISLSKERVTGTRMIFTKTTASDLIICFLLY
jgi:hypothetical protein